MKTDVLFSHKSDMWETPQYFFDELDAEFHFTLDACATEENAKCKSFYTPEQNGLVQPWVGNVWCNPPYGRQTGKWLHKAQKEIRTNADVIVMLLHARTDTRWFHDFVYKKPNVEIRFVRGRLKFGNSKVNAPFPSLVAIFRKTPEGGSDNE